MPATSATLGSAPRSSSSARDVVMDVDDGQRQRRGAVGILNVQVGAGIGQRARRVDGALPRGEHQRGEPALRWRQRGVRRQVVADLRERQAARRAIDVGAALRQQP